MMCVGKHMRDLLLPGTEGPVHEALAEGDVEQEGQELSD